MAAKHRPRLDRRELRDARRCERAAGDLGSAARDERRAGRRERASEAAVSEPGIGSAPGEGSPSPLLGNIRAARARRRRDRARRRRSAQHGCFLAGGRGSKPLTRSYANALSRI